MDQRAQEQCFVQLFHLRAELAPRRRRIALRAHSQWFNWMSLLHVSFLSALVGCAGAPFTRARRACHQQSESHYLLSTALKLRGGARLLPGSGSRLTTVGRPRHAAARLSVPLGPMVVALDFDGVCLDSEPEASRVAWRTACELWPWLTEECSLTERVMDESAYVDRRRLGGQPLCGTAADAMPLWLRAKMRLLR